MEEYILRVGLPVKCRKCGAKGDVIPRTDYGGWYKSKMLRKSNKWFCPEHYQVAKDMDDRFYKLSKTPEVKIVPMDTVDELYKLLD